MDTGTFKAPALQGSLSDLTFVLTELEVYNWGAFAGRHTAQFDLDGTAIIGPTGSGKTTLVDALMTLITANPRYNLASTGGHQSDRELVSYIRGVSGAGNKSGDNEHVARTGKTVSGLSACFNNGEQQLKIGAVFAVEGTSYALADVKRWWIFSQSAQHGLEQWLTAHREGGGRALKQLARETPGLQVYDASKNAYLAQVRRFFEVGENAFALLNRAAGLKQIDSIDEVFRELVLDDASAFERAAEVARQFDDLASIHAELETARAQQESLLPVESTWKIRQRLVDDLRLQQRLRALLPMWYAEHAHRQWTHEITQLDERIANCELRAQGLAEQIRVAESHAEGLRDIYLQAGGSSLEQLRELIEAQTRFVNERARYAQDYQRLARRLGLDDTVSLEAVLASQHQAREKKAAQVPVCRALNTAAWNAGATEQQLARELRDLQHELHEIESRPGSNLPLPYHQFRAAFAIRLQLAEERLPYVAELIEVKAEESAWRGAIERAIGAHRLRILVQERSMHDALRWVNDRDNRLHVRLQEVTDSRESQTCFTDSFIHKLNFKPHRSIEALKHLLCRVDRHCVDSAEALHSTPFALTQKGTMSGRDGQFDKQDQRPLDKDWMTGFDNKALLAELTQRLATLESAFKESQSKHTAAQSCADEAKQVLGLLDAVIQVHFATIDLPEAKRELLSSEQRLAILETPGSDAEQARARWLDADAHLKGLRKGEQELTVQTAELQTHRGHALAAQEGAFRRLGAGLDDEQRSLADQHFIELPPNALQDIDDVERKAAAALQQSLATVEAKLTEAEQMLVRAMEKAQKADTGALAEVGTEILDVEKYLDRLRILTEEALPQKLQRFLTYLNQSSDQGVTQLLSEIENQVSMIEERIEDLNSTLRRVDFQPARYLRLQPQRVTHDSLRQLQQAQRHLRSAVLKDDQGESHFRALRHMVDLLRDASDRKNTVGARALLDPRYRLHFEVSVIDRHSGIIIEVRTGSQGGSGGEKEIIASYVLTASLSYALSEGGTRPLFGTVVLDEAFSKSSHAVASRIISALTQFGLHPLFVTPNKELRLLRDHTRSAILVHRKGVRATLTSLTWDELQQHADRRKVDTSA